MCELSVMKGNLQELILRKKSISQASWTGIYIHEHFLTLNKEPQRVLLGMLQGVTKGERDEG